MLPMVSIPSRYVNVVADDTILTMTGTLTHLCREQRPYNIVHFSPDFSFVCDRVASRIIP